MADTKILFYARRIYNTKEKSWSKPVEYITQRRNPVLSL